MKIAYIMSRFPLLSETFILREMDMVEAQEGEITLYPLICQEQPVTHAEVGKWMPRRNCIPYMNFNVFKTTAATIFKKPLKFFVLLLSIIMWNLPSPKFLVRALVLLPKALAMGAQISKENVDHIHVHYASHPGLVAYIINSIYKIPYSITIHSHDIYDNHVMLSQKLGEAKFIVAISDYNVRYIENLLGPEISNKMHVVHCGVDPDTYKPITEVAGEKKEDFRILQIGSLHWKKGQNIFLESVKILKNKIPNLSVSIIGDGPERAEIEKSIASLNLEGTVTLLGAKTQTEVKDLLPTADCYVQSSLSEGIPVALMEALACELPVVATNITGIPEIIQHEETGLLVPPKDPKAIADAVTFMRENPNKAREFGKQGRRLVIKEFNLIKNAAQLNDLFSRYI